MEPTQLSVRDGGSPLHHPHPSLSPPPLIENHAGLTPVDIAKEKSHEECLELVSWSISISYVLTFVCLYVQLVEAERKKFGKCEHIDIDWGVDGEEDEIYQIPTTVSKPQPMASPGGIKRSDTTGNISGSKTPPVPKSPSSSTVSDVVNLRRPMSTIYTTSTKAGYSPVLSSENHMRPIAPSQLNVFPSPSDAMPPPPPPRGVSQNAEALPT